MRRWVYRPGHPKANQNGFVAFEDLGWEQPKEAKNAPIMVDRFYEGTSTTTVDEKGNTQVVDIGSRAKHRAFMRERGLTTADDFKETWGTAAKEREKFYKGDFDHKERRDQVGRALYERSKKNG